MPKTKILNIIAVLLVVNVIVFAVGVSALLANNQSEETKLYSASKFKLLYDEDKLAITNIGGFTYDTSGNLDRFELTLQNKDSTNAYSGTLEVSVEAQFSQIPVTLVAPTSERKIPIDLNPNLPTAEALAITTTIFITEITPPTPPPTSTPAPTTSPTQSSTSTPTPLQTQTPPSNPTPVPTSNPTPTPAPTSTPSPVPSGVDLVALKAAAIADSQIDGAIGTEWNDAKHYTSIPIDPQGTAEMWIKNDGTNLYIAVKFTADSNNPWVAMQMGSAGLHDQSVDLAVFGHDSLGANAYADANFGSPFTVRADASQNGKGAISVGSGNLVTVEFKKPLASGDTAGKDIAWNTGGTYTMVIVWNTKGNGASGGNISHNGGTTPTARKIFIGT